MSVEIDEKIVQQYAARNLDFIRDHLFAILDDAALLDEIPNGAHVVWLPDDDPELAAYNRAIGEQREREGKTVLYKRVPVQDVVSTGR